AYEWRRFTSIRLQRFFNSLPDAPTVSRLRKGSRSLRDHFSWRTIRRTRKTTIALRIDKKLQRGSLNSISQIGREIINPGKRQQPDPTCPLFTNGIPIGFEQSAILVQGIGCGCAPFIRVVREKSQRRD